MNPEDLGSSAGKKDADKEDRYVPVTLVSGLILVGVAILAAPDIFSRHNPGPEHVLLHPAYNALIVLCAILLIRGRIAEVLARLEFLDLKTFDALQYRVARAVASLASNVGKIQTGDLNLNMIGFLVGLVICLLSVLGFFCF